MRHTNCNPVRLLHYISLLAFALIVGRMAGAQTTYHAQTNAKLQTIVHLSLGKTTIKTVADMLSQQTSLRVEASDYLNERVVIVEIGNCSARTVLDALSACNDWTWSEQGDERIVIKRRVVRLPVTPAAVPRRVRIAIPKDIRDFLLIETPTDDLSQFAPRLFDDATGKHRQAVRKAIGQASGDFNTLLTTLISDLLTHGPVTCSNLPIKEQEQVISWLVFQALHDMDMNLLYSDLAPHVADANRAFVKTDGHELTIGSQFNIGEVHIETGFGVPFNPAR